MNWQGACLSPWKGAPQGFGIGFAVGGKAGEHDSSEPRILVNAPEPRDVSQRVLKTPFGILQVCKDGGPPRAGGNAGLIGRNSALVPNEEPLLEIPYFAFGTSGTLATSSKMLSSISVGTFES
jgi:hypothetical protein